MEDQEKIVAMTAEINSLKKARSNTTAPKTVKQNAAMGKTQANKKAQPKKTKEQKKMTSEKWAWKNKPPKDNDGKEGNTFVKTFEGKKYYWCLHDRIPSTNPGAEPPRDARDSGSARSHSTHLETSSSDRPKMVTYMEPQTVPSYMSINFTRRTLLMPSFTRVPHAQPSLSNFPWRDSDFGEQTRSHGTAQLEQNFPTSPKIKRPNLHIVRYR